MSYKHDEKGDPAKPVERRNFTVTTLGCGVCLFYGVPPRVKAWKTRKWAAAILIVLGSNLLYKALLRRAISILSVDTAKTESRE